MHKRKLPSEIRNQTDILRVKIVVGAFSESDKFILKNAGAHNLTDILIVAVDLLGLVTSQYKSNFCVSGTHGKTTVTSMLTMILLAAGIDASAVIGYIPLPPIPIKCTCFFPLRKFSKISSSLLKNFKIPAGFANAPTKSYVNIRNAAQILRRSISGQPKAELAGISGAPQARIQVKPLKNHQYPP